MNKTNKESGTRRKSAANDFIDMVQIHHPEQHKYRARGVHVQHLVESRQ